MWCERFIIEECAAWAGILDTSQRAHDWYIIVLSDYVHVSKYTDTVSFSRMFIFWRAAHRYREHFFRYYSGSNRLSDVVCFGLRIEFDLWFSQHIVRIFLSSLSHILYPSRKCHITGNMNLRAHLVPRLVPRLYPSNLSVALARTGNREKSGNLLVPLMH